MVAVREAGVAAVTRERMGVGGRQRRVQRERTVGIAAVVLRVRAVIREARAKAVAIAVGELGAREQVGRAFERLVAAGALAARQIRLRERGLDAGGVVAGRQRREGL